jgi:hypothetical protein
MLGKLSTILLSILSLSGSHQAVITTVPAVIAPILRVTVTYHTVTAIP